QQELVASFVSSPSHVSVAGLFCRIEEEQMAYPACQHQSPPLTGCVVLHRTKT
ncbi:uncharacterized protein V6R79_018118, partial [Siganus canaliculatus]